MNPSSHNAPLADGGNAEGRAIVFATNNSHKLDEIRAILGSQFEVLSLKDIDCHVDIPETANTLEGNAIQKARYIVEHYGYDCFADDTGLEVTALGGEPGVHSARYADGTDHDSEANMQKLLSRLKDKDDRRAQFRTVICLARKSDIADYTLFEGVVRGTIAKAGQQRFRLRPHLRPRRLRRELCRPGRRYQEPHITPRQSRGQTRRLSQTVTHPRHSRL